MKSTEKYLISLFTLLLAYVISMVVIDLKFCLIPSFSVSIPPLCCKAKIYFSNVNSQFLTMDQLTTKKSKLNCRRMLNLCDKDITCLQLVS